jgi:hypothetical protein
MPWPRRRSSKQWIAISTSHILNTCLTDTDRSDAVVSVLLAAIQHRQSCERRAANNYGAEQHQRTCSGRQFAANSRSSTMSSAADCTWTASSTCRHLRAHGTCLLTFLGGSYPLSSLIRRDRPAPRIHHVLLILATHTVGSMTGDSCGTGTSRQRSD